jgi:hypothetical protein
MKRHSITAVFPAKHSAGRHLRSHLNDRSLCGAGSDRGAESLMTAFEIIDFLNDPVWHGKDFLMTLPLHLGRIHGHGNNLTESGF